MVRILVDGNNLMFALADVGVDAGRGRLSAMLGEFGRREDIQVTVVYDGPPPRHRAKRVTGLKVHYSGRRTADEVLGELAAWDSAPRHVAVVSSDRAVQRDARRLGCKVVDALAFARQLRERPAAERTEAEPKAKRDGLDDGQVEHWMREFGLSD